MSPMAYNPKTSSVATEYVVPVTGDQFFIPGNCQAPTNSPDNPDNGTTAQRLASCQQLNPNGVERVAA